VRSPFAEVLRALDAAFRELGADYYVFGAQAALIHGAARLTADVDVTVRMDPEDPARLIAALGGNGFTTRIQDPDFVARTRVLPVLHEPTGINADVVLAGPGIEELFLRRAERREIDGVVVSVACAADLIVMKILAGRPKDLQDVEAIVAANADLDVDQVQETLTLLETALDQSDLRPVWQSILQRVRGHS
jgi:Nucleotidyltransferase of unknown function (DUF6036)